MIVSYIPRGLFCEFLEGPFGNLIGYYGPLLAILINLVGYFYQKADSGGVKQTLINFQRAFQINLIDPRGFTGTDYS